MAVTAVKVRDYIHFFLIVCIFKTKTLKRVIGHQSQNASSVRERFKTFCFLNTGKQVLPLDNSTSAIFCAKTAYLSNSYKFN